VPPVWYKRIVIFVPDRWIRPGGE